jgi:hypothetical protein
MVISGKPRLRIENKSITDSAEKPLAFGFESEEAIFC